MKAIAALLLAILLTSCAADDDEVALEDIGLAESALLSVAPKQIRLAVESQPGFAGRVIVYTRIGSGAVPVGSTITYESPASFPPYLSAYSSCVPPYTWGQNPWRAICQNQTVTCPASANIGTVIEYKTDAVGSPWYGNWPTEGQPKYARVAKTFGIYGPGASGVSPYTISCFYWPTNAAHQIQLRRVL